jgi:hypothetical protein
MKATTKTIEPCLGIPVRFSPAARVICDSRGIWRWKEIVVGPDFFRFPPAEQQALLLHEAGHCLRFHVERRILAILTRPWAVAGLCRAQEYEADNFVRSAGRGLALASAFSRLRSAPGPFHPPLSERISRLI